MLRTAKTVMLSLCLMVMLSSCSHSPTGRNQLLLFSGDDMANLGQRSFEEMKKSQPISDDKAINAYVQCVTAAILKVVPPQSNFSEWEVVVFDSDQVNAFALPGGKIGVYTGLLDVAKTPDQLAAVIGHEIGHVLADHSNERLSRSQLTALGLTITGITLSDNPYGDLALAGLGLGVQVGILLPYNRAQESESDKIGLQLMHQAGFDPSASVTLWQNMAKASKGAPPELLSTHPSPDTRINALQTGVNQLPNVPHRLTSSCPRPPSKKQSKNI
ncbi:Zn-dependent protease [Salinivibrio sp. PR6]|uniref:Zn-dependent protease n=2 Tax=Vibrionaceae TaxID=641 RepID=A0ABX3K9V3_9GAMM|nr:Zn-dependent protease [Salinivibrio sp. IB868]OOE74269.1 Zn-dependent protease [Salinivibrio sp. IB870]OOE74767.1 Zn-dependent protease [Salinivibrio sp. ML290]OOE78507.1 Zn-dependent protease [Salinivibrio sp. ML198]OOE79341.1 Zn-dependent protease [Salinivibrio sp. PR6]OOE85621.1 Zn-dependent protease [Salinivibrio siamensis]